MNQITSILQVEACATVPSVMSALDSVHYHRQRAGPTLHVDRGPLWL